MDCLRFSAKYLAVCAAVLLAACGGSSSSDSSSDAAAVAAASSPSQLPNATDGVSDASSGSLSAKSLLKTATTGLIYSTTTSDNFSSSSSNAACDMFNMTKMGFESAAQPDKVFCYVKEISGAIDSLVDKNVAITTILGASAASTLDIFDGITHVFTLDASSMDSGAPDHIKLKFNKLNGSFTGAEMFMCKSGAQTQYVSQSISGSTMTVTSRDKHADGTMSMFSGMDASGAVSSASNGDVVWTSSKTIALFFADLSAEDSFWGRFNLTQTPNRLTSDVYGEMTFNSQTGTFQNYGQAELLGSNLSTNLAMGDGCSKYKTTSSEFTNDNSATPECWSADTTLAVSDTSSFTPADIYTAVNSASFPAAPTQPSTGFSASQAYGCDGTLEGVIDLAVLDTLLTANGLSTLSLNTACGDMDHTWIDCFSDDQSDEESQQQQGGGDSESEDDGEFSGTWAATSGTDTCSSGISGATPVTLTNTAADTYTATGTNGFSGTLTISGAGACTLALTVQGTPVSCSSCTYSTPQGSNPSFSATCVGQQTCTAAYTKQ